MMWVVMVVWIAVSLILFPVLLVMLAAAARADEQLRREALYDIEREEA